MALFHASKDSNRAPTYTTVGSIYNPQAATPLQPPTRRGRSLRYNSYQSPTDAPAGFGLSKSSSGPSMRDGMTRTSPHDRTNLQQQYSPLQQNYDRAVSPTATRDGASPGSLDARIASLGDENASYSHPTGLGVSTIAANDNDPSGQDVDDVVPEDSLASRFNVKGLTNLASYPNPMQKTAQKALARGRSAHLSNVDRLSSSTTRTGSDPAKDGIAAQPDSPTLLRYLPPGFRPGDDSASDDAISGSTNRPYFAAKESGAPQPLTAGPPGQRQYRQATFEAPRAAFQDPPYNSWSQGQPKLGPYQPGYAPTPRAPAPSSRQVASSSHREFGGKPSQTFDQRAPGEDGITTSFKTLAISDLASEPMTADEVSGDTMSQILAISRRNITETLPPHMVTGYYPDGLPPDHCGQSWALPVGPDEKFATPRAASAYLAARQLAAHRAHVDQAFYAGTDGLGKSMDQVARETVRRQHEAPIRVKNEEWARPRHVKTVYPIMSVEEANRRSGPEHVAPLLSMAFDTLARYAEQYTKKSKGQVSRNGFGMPDPRLVDVSPTGNKSFFETRAKVNRPLRRRLY